MAMLGHGMYRCPYCGAEVEDVPFAVEPDVTLLADERGDAYVWVLLVDGRHVHCCSDADDELSDRARQAMCFIARRVGCGLREAFERLRALADQSAQTLEHTALDVLDGVLPVDV